MKKYTIVLIALVAFSSFSFSQVSKASVLGMLSELGSSMEKVETLYIGNVKTFYNDGTWKKTYAKYNVTWTNGTNKFAISDQGIIMKSYEGARLDEIQLYPFSSIINIKVTANYIDIELMD